MKIKKNVKEKYLLIDEFAINNSDILLLKDIGVIYTDYDLNKDLLDCGRMSKSKVSKMKNTFYLSLEKVSELNIEIVDNQYGVWATLDDIIVNENNELIDKVKVLL